MRRMCASARRPKMRLRSPGAPRRSPLRRMPRGTLVEGAWRDSATRSSSRHCSKATSAACPPVQLSLRGVLRRTPGAADRMEDPWRRSPRQQRRTRLPTRRFSMQAICSGPPVAARSPPHPPLDPSSPPHHSCRRVAIAPDPIRPLSCS